jgi:hypothetical protein
MKYITKRIKIHFLLAITAIMFILSSCNKNVEQFPLAAAPVQDTAPTVARLLDAADMTIFKAAVVRASTVTSPSILSQLQNTSLRFTIIAPNDAAMTASGLSLAVVNGAPIANIVGLVQYNILPQTVAWSTVTGTFPNFQYPTILNPAPTLSALLRLTTFPSKINGNWVNNIPVTAIDIPAVNGVMHKTALVVAPPSQFLIDKLNADPDFSILRAALTRADSGVAPTTSASLVWALTNIGPNLTLFAPGNTPFKGLLSALTGGAIPVSNYVSAAGATNVLDTITVASTAGLVPGMTVTVTGGTGAFAANTLVVSVISGTKFKVSAAPTTALSAGAVVTGDPTSAFIGLLASNNVSTQTVKGIVVYHILGTRAFSNNFSTAGADYPTLLNGAIPSHVGLNIKVTFTGPSVSAMTVKGAVNPTASIVLINPTPAPNGTSDQHYVNGVMFKIDQVLRPL